MTRIALFCEVFLPKVDGVVNTVCRLLEHLQRHGHESLLFAPAGGPQRYAQTPIIGLPSYRVPFYPELRLALPPQNLNRYLDEFKPDILHLINPIALSLTGLRYARKAEIPTVASYHTDIAGFATHWGLGFLSPLIWAYLRKIHNQADLNLVPSRFTYCQLNANDFRNLKIWSRGVDTNLFSPSMRCTAWRERLSRGDVKAPLLLYVGRLSAEKRVIWLRHVLKSLPGTRLAIVGDGPQRNVLETEFSGTPTVFTGYLRGEELAHAYASSDLFVFPGANETFGNVVLEAMACGLPVVVPDSGGVTDLIQPYETGLLFQAEDVSSLVASVEELLQDTLLRQRLSDSGRSAAQTRDWNGVLDGLLEDYASLIRDSKYTRRYTSYKHPDSWLARAS